VDPERRVVVRHLLPALPEVPYTVSGLGQGRLESQAVPGFWIDVSWLWQDPLPDELRCLEQLLSG
jgi:hypothetical protein